MKGVSCFNKDSGDRQAPLLPAGLVELMSTLTGPADFWDRPDGDFGMPAESVEPDRAARQRANSLYRLGSRALGRGDLHDAVSWLGDAVSAGHPGALFRLAVVALRAGEDWEQDAWFLVAEAARLGHGDAARLVRALGHRRPDAESEVARAEDGEYFDEARQLLGVSEEMLVAQAPEDPSKEPGGLGAAVHQVPPGAGASTEAGPSRLFLVTAPPLPPLSSAARPDSAVRPDSADRQDGTDDRSRPTAAAPDRVPVLQLPDLRAADVPRTALAGDPRRALGEEPWWSANALRPAVLNNMARNLPARTTTPHSWQAAQRARDLVHLINGADGIDTRTLAHRTRLSMNTTTRFLDWLRDQHLITTVGGAHHPGPLMRLTTQPNRELLRQTLADLRDNLDAAVYLSSYTDGEIHIHEAAYSHTAPAVDEWAPFTDTGHASAVGKCLLAQLDFDSRMAHLSRYPSVQLTERTITNPRDLLEELDGHGPHAAQFDLLEYSRKEVCVAYSLGLPGRASGIALSLPAQQYGRLITAARSLSKRATGILLAHLIADDTAAHSARPGRDDMAPEPRRALP
ncbi:IclR family transcriptional regulator C-terminal domain-containing protein [Streptomyces monticola]|uniref:IclR family transcriptional regulator C-terminal domain-containing protein n=1 Tax=Streptomyces monticola TaxID=2666263 RepID=A0ABW2JMS1_9ACTN